MSDKRELTAVEVLKTIRKICNTRDHECESCPFNEQQADGKGLCIASGPSLSQRASSIVEICAKWHKEHWKEHIETEWVYRCAIVEETDDVLFRVKVAFCDGEADDADELVEALLKECYAEKPNKKYIGYRDLICRIKE